MRNIDDNVIGNIDTSLMARLFTNLISNAYQYSNPGSTISISLKNINNEIEFIVSDTGIGIPEDKLDKIWDRFYQVNAVRDPNNNSSGLGLSIVKWISDIHGGKINVKSKIGEGTTFIFKF